MKLNCMKLYYKIDRETMSLTCACSNVLSSMLL